MVARVLGAEYGLDVQIAGDGAWTNGKTINIPVLPEDDARAALFARGYLDHEAGHVRFTDFQISGNTPLEQWLANVFEDVRIEKAMGTKFPGCKLNLSRVAEALASEGKFSPDGQSPIPRQAGFFILTLARADILRQKGLKEVAVANEKLLREKLPERTVNRLKGLIWRCDSIASSQDSLELAKIVLKEIQDEIDNQPEPPPEEEQREKEKKENQPEQEQAETSQQEDSDPSTQEDDPQAGQCPGDPSDSPQNQSGENQDGQQPAGSSSGGQAGQADEKNPSKAGSADSPDDQERGGTSAGENPTGDPKAIKEALKQILEATDGDLPQGLGAVLAEQLAQAGDDQGEYVNPDAIRIPGDGYASSSPDFAPKMEDVKRETAALRARLQGMVQASRLQRSFPKRTGHRVDPRVLTRVAGGDSRIFRSQFEKAAVNTAVVILLDRSSSMDGVQMDVAKQAVLAAASALEVIPGVAVSTALFPANNSPVAPITRFGQKVRAEDYGISASGGTPLAPALWWSAASLLARPEPRKIVLVATDGEPANAPAVHAAIRRMSAEGIELMGLGICTPAVERFFAVNSVIHKIQELPKSMFGMLQTKLVKKVA